MLLYFKPHWSSFFYCNSTLQSVLFLFKGANIANTDCSNFFYLRFHLSFFVVLPVLPSRFTTKTMKWRKRSVEFYCSGARSLEVDLLPM